MDEIEALNVDDCGGGGGRSSEEVRWESFLPRVVLRVLLVEADHSTRLIITALLRRCNYAVTAVSDGLKAWETLKNKATELDLILTEVELPSISGFALLTLIMEHDVCKNIPVIMMSSHDSVSMVLKCMLKGAADFLIKPVRRNELRNLWQHVWRRHTEKHKIASQDDSASNQSSGSVASSQKNNDCPENLSEAQGAPQLKSSSKLSNIDLMQHEESIKFESESAKNNDETGAKSVAFVLEAASCNKNLQSTDLRIEQDHCFAETDSPDEVLRAELSRVNSNSSAKIRVCSDAVIKSSRGAIDLIDSFENLEKPANEICSFNDGNSTKFDLYSKLELSLRNDFRGSSCKQAGDASMERQRLNHSNTSAFSWYSGSSKLLQPRFPTPTIISAKVNNTDRSYLESHKSSRNALDTSQYGDASKNPENTTTLVNGRLGQFEPKLSSYQFELLPVTEVTSDFKSKGHGNFFSSVFYSGVHPVCNQKPVLQKESSPFPTTTSSQSNLESHNSEQHHYWSDDATCTSPNQNVHDNSDLDDARHDSSAAGQSAGNCSCYDAASRINSCAYESIGSGSDGNATSIVIDKNNPEKFSDNGHHHNYDGFRGSHLSSQREAALAKFRLKRKARCYDKKVRYQSRKRLAEQRPRVKGQFVRQVQHGYPVSDAGGDS